MAKILSSTILIFVSILTSLAQCQQIADPKDVLLKMASARERILQYTVLCEVKGSIGDVSVFLPDYKPTTESRLEVWIENSRVDDHLLTAVRDLDPKANRKFWALRGTSESIGLVSNEEGGIGIRNIDKTGGIDRNRPGRTKNYMFDPLAIGLGFCVEFLGGKTFEEQLAGIFTWTKVKPYGAKVENDVFNWQYNVQSELVIDMKKSYWPTMLKDTGAGFTHEIKVELGKFEDYDIPEKVHLKCSAPNGAVTETDIVLKWESINKPVETGEKCLTRIAERFGKK